MNAVNYKFLTRPNFSTRYMNTIKYQKETLSDNDRYRANITRNLGGCKLFPYLRRSFDGQVNSFILVEKN